MSDIEQPKKKGRPVGSISNERIKRVNRKPVNSRVGCPTGTKKSENITTIDHISDYKKENEEDTKKNWSLY